MSSASKKVSLSVIEPLSRCERKPRQLHNLLKRLIAVEPPPDFGKVIRSSFQPYRRIIE